MMKSGDSGASGGPKEEKVRLSQSRAWSRIVGERGRARRGPQMSREKSKGARVREPMAIPFTFILS
jgi:hypothetical protein